MMTNRPKRGGRGSLRPRAPSRQDYTSPAFEERKQRIYEFIVRFATLHRGHMPSRREICEATDTSSTSVATYHLQALLREGKLSLVNGRMVVSGSTYTAPAIDPLPGR